VTNFNLKHLKVYSAKEVYRMLQEIARTKCGKTSLCCFSVMLVVQAGLNVSMNTLDLLCVWFVRHSKDALVRT